MLCPLYLLGFLLLLHTQEGLQVEGFGNNNLKQFFGQRKAKTDAIVSAAKQELLNALDDPEGFSQATKERTSLVAAMTMANPTPKPGSTASFTPLATGTWTIVYAPHISTMGNLLFGSFNPVYYILEKDGTMTSHAKFEFPLIGSGWLSVSGTYSSQDEDQQCRVDFDKAWIKVIEDEKEKSPYMELESVPSGPVKNAINQLGKLFFVDSVSVFPVSYLDQDTIVFDFELLGTRICARKVKASL